jgi:VanZ family protein
MTLRSKKSDWVIVIVFSALLLASSLVLVFSALLLASSLVPKWLLGDELRGLLQGRDKILHVIGYAMLAAFACRAFAGREKAGMSSVFACGAALAIGYGVLLEALQQVIGGRTCSLADAGANAAGAAAGALLYVAFSARLKAGTNPLNGKESLSD